MPKTLAPAPEGGMNWSVDPTSGWQSEIRGHLGFGETEPQAPSMPNRLLSNNGRARCRT